MQAADLLGVLENRVEPTSGAADWLRKLLEHMRCEIGAASEDQFPSARLTPELAAVALGHLATHEDHKSALRSRLVSALPLEDISLAGDYTPSRASGMLVPVAKAAASELSPRDEQLRLNLVMMVDSFKEEKEFYESEVKDRAQEFKEFKGRAEEVEIELDRVRIQIVAMEDESVSSDNMLVSLEQQLEDLVMRLRQT